MIREVEIVFGDMAEREDFHVGEEVTWETWKLEGQAWILGVAGLGGVGMHVPVHGLMKMQGTEGKKHFFLVGRWEK